MGALCSIFATSCESIHFQNKNKIGRRKDRSCFTVMRDSSEQYMKFLEQKSTPSECRPNGQVSTQARCYTLQYCLVNELESSLSYLLIHFFPPGNTQTVQTPHYIALHHQRWVVASGSWESHAGLCFWLFCFAVSSSLQKGAIILVIGFALCYLPWRCHQSVSGCCCWLR